MVFLLLLLALVLMVLCFIPAVLLTARAQKEKRARQSWMRVTGTLVRVETAQQYQPSSQGAGHYSTYMRGHYEYLDPRGGVHRGHARVKGVNLAGEPEAVPLLVNPQNWDESMLLTDGQGRGCALALAWTLPVFGFGLCVVMILVAAMIGMVNSAPPR